MSHNRDKGKKESKKKAQHDIKEKRKLKKEKTQQILLTNLKARRRKKALK
ncbi:MAG: hypothetical protein HXY38_05180 [Chloroflexi bacterium]|nr:hypothetical protein [Chloroflexota bacterium]